MKHNIYEDEEEKLDISQMDFMANLYYDFNARSKFSPFVGIGAGYVKPKAHYSVEGEEVGEDSAEADATFAMSASLGFAYDLTDHIAFEMMGRGKYIFNKGKLYNLEALTGLRFSL